MRDQEMVEAGKWYPSQKVSISFCRIETKKLCLSMQIEGPQAFLCNIYDQIVFLMSLEH